MVTNKNSDVTHDADAVTSFRVDIPQVAIDDLKRRLAATRWPDRETVGDRGQGVPLGLMTSLLSRWQDKYDWRKFEDRINQFPQFRTNIDGLGIHFLHVRSRHQNALPIILTHVTLEESSKRFSQQTAANSGQNKIWATVAKCAEPLAIEKGN